jgi:uncharacterized protein
MKRLMTLKQNRIVRRLGLSLALASGLALASLASFLMINSVTGSAKAAPKPIPTPPYYYVLDEPHVLSPRALHTVETLLIEHDRIVGEQVLVAIFKNLGDEDVVDYTNRVFSTWKIGKRG